jgi:hypothetical protein
VGRRAVEEAPELRVVGVVEEEGKVVQVRENLKMLQSWKTLAMPVGWAILIAKVAKIYIKKWLERHTVTHICNLAEFKL